MVLGCGASSVRTWKKGEGEGDLYESLNDVDVTEEEDSPPLVRLCLLSRFEAGARTFVY